MQKTCLLQISKPIFALKQTKMVEAYQQAREKFLKELRFIFPHSSNLILEINVDNITTKDFEQLPLPYKDETLAGGALNWKSAAVTNEDFTDTFNSEYL